MLQSATAPNQESHLLYACEHITPSQTTPGVGRAHELRADIASHLVGKTRPAYACLRPSSKLLSEAPNSKLELPQQQMQKLSVQLGTSEDFILFL